MTNKWVAEFHEATDEVQTPWWMIKKDGDWRYFIVEECGDETDGDRLAAMLNERDELIAKDMRREKLLKEIVEQAPQYSPRIPERWRFEYDAEQKQWRIYHPSHVPPIFVLKNFGDGSDGGHLCNLLNEYLVLEGQVREYRILIDRIQKEISGEQASG